MTEAAARLIPSYGLDLSRVPMGDRDEVWRDAFVRHYDMLDTPPILDARGQVFHLGKAVLSDTVQPRNFVREAARARRDGMDNILVSVELTGGFHVATEEREEDVGVGRVTLFDVARPVVKRGAPGRTLVLGVSRELVEDALPGLDIHGLTLGGEGALMAEHLRSLRNHMPATAATAAPFLVRSTVQMLAACVQPTAERLERARPALATALLARAKRYLRANCRDPELTPDRVASAVGASRTSLYRAFEPEGGVAEFIRRTRLAAARAALTDPADGRRIGEIGFAFGFSSEAQFSRAVRAAFGATPSELRRGLGGLYVRLKDDRWVLKGWREAAGSATAADVETGQVIAWRPRDGGVRRSV